MAEGEILKELSDGVEKGDEEAVKTISQAAIEKGIDPVSILEQGLTRGLLNVGERWRNGDAFITEVMLASTALNEGLKIIEPEIQKKGGKYERKGKIIIGTVQGDIHSIGKMIVAIMLEAAGFEVYDLGVDVPAKKFIDEVRKIKSQILCLSALLTTTMLEQKNVIDLLRMEGIRDAVKVMVGGAPVTKEWADEIGADAYGENAIEAVDKAIEIVEKK